MVCAAVSARLVADTAGCAFRALPDHQVIDQNLPLLGLLGTVTGMLEVFDAMAATGSNNARLMAAGVSKATVSTLAGMVVAIMALLTTTVIERRVALERDRLGHQFVLLLDGK
jgi:biopolymer transport protein ExbB